MKAIDEAEEAMARITANNLIKISNGAFNSQA